MKKCVCANLISHGQCRSATRVASSVGSTRQLDNESGERQSSYWKCSPSFFSPPLLPSADPQCKAGICSLSTPLHALTSLDSHWCDGAAKTCLTLPAPAAKIPLSADASRGGHGGHAKVSANETSNDMSENTKSAAELATNPEVKPEPKPEPKPVVKDDKWTQTRISELEDELRGLRPNAFNQGQRQSRNGRPRKSR